MVWVGRRAREPLVEAAQDYLTRLGHYATVSLTRIKDGTMDDERRAIERHLGEGTEVVALEVGGVQLTTPDVVVQVRRWQESQASVTFLVGGADGLHSALRARAQRTWGLSGLTLPHRLAQVLLVEQLYRAHTILRGAPYRR